VKIFNLVWKLNFVFKIPAAQNSLSHSEAKIVAFKESSYDSHRVIMPGRKKLVLSRDTTPSGEMYHFP